MDAPQENKVQRDDLLGRIAQVSLQIRQAVCEAIPASPDQFLTLVVPGKTVDLTGLADGFDGLGERITPVAPLHVQLQEAILCDDMPALSAVQFGSTHRSVARSYAATLGKFYSTTSATDGVPEEKLSATERRYRYAMDWLTGRDPGGGGKTRVEIYREKQENYAEALKYKDKEFAVALKRAMADTSDIIEGRAAFEMWVLGNQNSYDNLVQAAYMDWVTTGRKEELESHFSIVDNDSVMSRIEASKASMRNSVINAQDGPSEYYKVQLYPNNWAWLVKKKAGRDFPNETRESLTFKIAHLQKINFLLESIRENPGFIIKEDDDTTAEGEGPPPEGPEEDIPCSYFEAENNYHAVCEEYGKAVEEKHPEPRIQQLKEDRERRHAHLEEVQARLNDCLKKIERKNVDALTYAARRARKELFTMDQREIRTKINMNELEIGRLHEMRHGLFEYDLGRVMAEVQDELVDKAGIPRVLTPDSIAADDCWTSIRFEVASRYSCDPNTTGALGFTVDTSANHGLLCAAVNTSHNESYINAMRQMVNASVQISFDCMRVDIARPWLRKELFYDSDLRVPEGDYVSPGPLKLMKLMDPSNPNVNGAAREAEKYDLFPMYPTAFLVAANIVLRVVGKTSGIQTYLGSSSTSASARIDYGPFSIGGRGAQSAGGFNSICEVTATGCKITMRSPQIIGWISDVLPALPRTR